MEENSHLKLYRFTQGEYSEAATIWNGTAPADYTEGIGTTDQFEFVDAPPEGGDLSHLAGIASSFAPNYAPEEIMEIATKLYDRSKS